MGVGVSCTLVGGGGRCLPLPAVPPLGPGLTPLATPPQLTEARVKVATEQLAAAEAALAAKVAAHAELAAQHAELQGQHAGLQVCTRGRGGVHGAGGAVSRAALYVCRCWYLKHWGPGDVGGGTRPRMCCAAEGIALAHVPACSPARSGPASRTTRAAARGQPWRSCRHDWMRRRRRWTRSGNRWG